MNLQCIVRSYVRDCRPGAKDELNWFRGQRTLSSTIRFAALAIDSKGKRFSHQRRLSKTTLQGACCSLLRNESKIRLCKDFDELHTLLDSLLHRTKGVGELYIYDTALRIGAKLGFLPTKVYLHAGTRVGVRASPDIRPYSNSKVSSSIILI
jgi:hypothetical protein